MRRAPNLVIADLQIKVGVLDLGVDLPAHLDGAFDLLVGVQSVAVDGLVLVSIRFVLHSLIIIQIIIILLKSNCW